MPAPDAPVLIIPDIHQDLAFLEQVCRLIDRVKPGRLIFLGDYFDPLLEKWEAAPAVEAFCRRLTSLASEWGKRATWLCGNHDMPYLLARYNLPTQEGPVARDRIECFLQFTWEKAARLDACLGPGFWDRLELVTNAHGFLLSHAGLHPHWLARPSLRGALLQARQAWTALVKGLPALPDPDKAWILATGTPRGGSDPVGGPLWLDWSREFSDIPGLPQIVGHSRGPSPRQMGASTCLDCAQTLCALLDSTGVGPRGVQVLSIPAPI